ncbi:hypothetical protein Q2941_29245 [Bradyrhizobium sp. UFLA05-153]
MAISRQLTDLLEENLSKVNAPHGYTALRDKLMQSKIAPKPDSAAPAIKQSPENSLKLDE